jgi:small neutral amino acid transporter SnatA (MarC family)
MSEQQQQQQQQHALCAFFFQSLVVFLFFFAGLFLSRSVGPIKIFQKIGALTVDAKKKPPHARLTKSHQSY